MSYILEALRKSEQERNPEKVPDLETHHRHVVGQVKKSFPFWILGVVLLLINGLALFYVFNKETIPEPEMVVQKKVEIPTAEIVQPEPEPEPEPENVNVNVIPEPVVVETIVASAPAPKPTLNSSSVSDISELPYDLQRQIPDMDFSTHIYVRDGGSFIIINGKTLNEGMIVARGLRVIKILSDGIILEFRNRQFFMVSMTNWVQD
ncbi:MAG: general secretion pathway protein GspB [Gammaproteobacteria bacterium]|nr:general secretion pathway protein GspB [Gammaproteobacteria bacterium]